MRRAMRVRDCTATERLAVKCAWEGRIVTVLLEAAIRGALAIHPSQGPDLPLWTVTHVATGYAIARFDWEADAENFVRMILPLDWNFSAVSECPKATSAGVLAVAGAHNIRLPR